MAGRNVHNDRRMENIRINQKKRRKKNTILFVQIIVIILLWRGITKVEPYLDSRNAMNEGHTDNATVMSEEGIENTVE